MRITSAGRHTDVAAVRRVAPNDANASTPNSLSSLGRVVAEVVMTLPKSMEVRCTYVPLPKEQIGAIVISRRWPGGIVLQCFIGLFRAQVLRFHPAEQNTAYAITEPNTGSQESRVHHFRLNKADLAPWYLWQVALNHRLPRLKPGRFYPFQLALPRQLVAVLDAPTAVGIVD